VNVSRKLSPQQTVRLAERGAKDAEQRRKAKRRSWLIIGGVAVLSIGLVVADYFWIRHQARQRHEQRLPSWREKQRSRFRRAACRKTAIDRGKGFFVPPNRIVDGKPLHLGRTWSTTPAARAGAEY
jgi:hypothetical protein